MADDNKVTVRQTSYIPFLAIFIVLKVYGPLAAWSWLWIFLPWWPTLVFFFQKIGWI